MRVYPFYPGCGTRAGGRSEGCPSGQEGPPPAQQDLPPSAGYPPPRADASPRGDKCGSVAYTADGAFGAAYGMDNCDDAEAWLWTSVSGNRPDKPDCSRGAVTKRELLVLHPVLQAGQRMDDPRHDQANAFGRQSGCRRVGAEVQVRQRQLPPRSQRPSALRRSPYEDVAGDSGRFSGRQSHCSQGENAAFCSYICVRLFPVEASDASAWP